MDIRSTQFDLRSEVWSVLEKQGFSINNGSVVLADKELLSREQKRDVHVVAKIEKLHKHKDFLLKSLPVVQKYMVDGVDIDVQKIKPVIRLVEPGTEDEIIFKWWNLAWWSLPYERAYGRQMRFIVWDEYHNAPMGLIGLQSPVLSWKARDEYLSIEYENRDYWVNQSMSAQRLGALPPYNHLLGGKLVGMMLTSNTIRNTFENKYSQKKTLIKGRILPARLLFLTTTGAFGRSSVYDRLKFDNHKIVEHIGMTKGSGTFHIPDNLYDELIGFLTASGVDTKRGYGGGPSRKMKLIGLALSRLGIKNGTQHGIQRAVYLFPLASNIREVINNGAVPDWYNHEESVLAEFWKERWAAPRAERNDAYRSFQSQMVIDDMLKALESCDE